LQPEPADNAAHSDLVVRALDELVRAAHQWSLYGPEHPVAKQACDTAAEAFLALISERSHFTLTVVESGLLAEGQQLPDHASLRQLHQALHARQVAALTIHPALTWDEIAVLIGVLGTSAPDLAERGGARRALQEAGCQHLEIAEVDYTRFVPTSQAQWLSAFAGAQVNVHSTVEGLVGACLELAGERLHIAQAGSACERGLPMPFPVPVAPGAAEVDEIPLQAEIAALGEVALDDYVAVGLAWLVQASGEAMVECQPRERRQWREAVGERFAKLDPALQARIFRAPRQAGSRGPDLLAAIIADRSPDEIADLILARPAAVVGEPSASLERILRRTLTDERKLLAVEPLLRQRLMARGMSQDSFRNVVGLLLDQIAADTAMRVGGAVGRLGDFDAGSLPAGGTVDDWPELLRTLDADAVAASRVRVLLTMLPYEHDAARYLDLAGHLEACAVERAAAGDRGAVMEVVSALAREVDEGKPTRAPIAVSALQRLATEQVAQGLRETLAEVTAERRPELLEIAAKMGNECAEVLLEEAQRAEDPKLRSLALRLLADAGERGAAHVRHLLAQAPPDQVMSAAGAMIEGRHERFISHLAAGLGHRQPLVRLRVAEWLRRVPGLAAEQILIRALYDDDPGVQAQAAESLGEIGARGAVHALALVALKGQLHGRRFEVRKAAVRALGRIGCPEAVPALTEIMRKHGLLFRERVEELCALAAAALAQIPGPEAQQALADCATPGAAANARRAECAATGPATADGDRHG